MAKRMRKGGKKISHRTRQKQKFALKVMTGFTILTAGMLIRFTTLFNGVGIQDAKAGAVNVIQVDEQVFTNEMSVAKPEFRSDKLPGPHTIQIQKKAETISAPASK
jgi:hypothetical protein